MFLCSLSTHRHFQTSVINFSSVNAASQSRSVHICLCQDWISAQLCLETGQLSCVLPSVVKIFGRWSVQKCVLKYLWDQDLRRFRHTSSFKNINRWYTRAGRQVPLPWQSGTPVYLQKGKLLQGGEQERDQQGGLIGVHLWIWVLAALQSSFSSCSTVILTFARFSDWRITFKGSLKVLDEQRNWIITLLFHLFFPPRISIKQLFWAQTQGSVAALELLQSDQFLTWLLLPLVSMYFNGLPKPSTFFSPVLDSRLTWLSPLTGDI